MRFLELWALIVAGYKYSLGYAHRRPISMKKEEFTEKNLKLIREHILLNVLSF
jgi:hypothetical protein